MRTPPDPSTLQRLERDTGWRCASSVEVRTEVGHPQGLLPWGDHWLVTTVHATARGELLVVDDAGAVLERVDVTDGERFHPGGVGASHDGCVVPVAEYRPASTTTVVHVDPSLAVTELFRSADHLGAVADLGDGTLLAASWGSRTWYRLDRSGAVLDSRANPSWYVDFQDLTVVDDRTVIATGVGAIVAPSGRVQLGGLAVVDVDSLAVEWQVPVQAWMPSGRVATYNGAHVWVHEDHVALSCIVDDQSASIATWVVDA